GPYETCPSYESWLQTQYDRMPPVLKTFEEQKNEGILRPTPKEVIDLIRAVPTQEVIDYCKSQGWLLPDDVVSIRVEKDINKMVTNITKGLSIIASLCAITGFVYLMYTVFAKGQ
nr:3A [Bat picornavirus 2]